MNVIGWGSPCVRVRVCLIDCLVDRLIKRTPAHARPHARTLVNWQELRY